MMTRRSSFLMKHMIFNLTLNVSTSYYNIPKKKTNIDLFCDAYKEICNVRF
jgi:hypothetical protein